VALEVQPELAALAQRLDLAREVGGQPRILPLDLAQEAAQPRHACSPPATDDVRVGVRARIVISTARRYVPKVVGTVVILRAFADQSARGENAQHLVAL